MAVFTWIVCRIVALVLDVLLGAMLIRAVMSWFMGDDDNRFVLFLYYLTEPVILPIRKLCNRFGWFEESPLDMPFLLTSCVLAILSSVVTFLA